MIYTKDEIKDILWNVFTIHAKDIIFLDHVGDEYWYDVILENDLTLNILNELGDELYETELFDIINKGKDKLLIKYIGESEVLTIEQLKILNESTSNEYVEFNDGQIKRIKTLYSFLPQNVAYTNFVQSVFNKVIKDKKLTKKQWINLEEILNTGKSTYNNKKLTTKN